MIVCHLCGSKNCFEFSKKNGYVIFGCSDCGLLFVDPITAAPTEIYGKEYFEGATGGFGYVSYDEDKEPMRTVFAKYLELIDRELGGKKGKLLDVGAATGFFVQMASEAGYIAEGADISEHAAKVGRSKGRSVYAGTIDDVEGSFDVITMLDLIEHVPDPRGVLQKACTLLRPGGVLIINAPDAGSFVARLFGRYWHLISPPEHLHYFNRKNMRRLLEDEGFGISRMMTVGKKFTLKYIFKTLNRSTHIALFESISALFSRQAFSRLSIPINLYDNMFVIAIKKI